MKYAVITAAVVVLIGVLSCAGGPSEPLAPMSEGEYEVMRVSFASGASLPASQRVRRIVLNNGAWTEYNADGERLMEGRYNVGDDGVIEVNWAYSVMEFMEGGTSFYSPRLKNEKYMVKISNGSDHIGTLVIRRMP